MRNTLFGIFLTFSLTAVGQQFGTIDTLYMKEQNLYCEEGHVLYVGILPDQQKYRYKCFVTDFNNTVALIYDRGKMVEIFFYERNLLECMGETYTTYDQLELSLKMKKKEYLQKLFIDGKTISELKEVTVIYLY